MNLVEKVAQWNLSMADTSWTALYTAVYMHVIHIAIPVVWHLAPPSPTHWSIGKFDAGP